MPYLCFGNENQVGVWQLAENNRQDKKETINESTEEQEQKSKNHH